MSVSVDTLSLRPVNLHVNLERLNMLVLRVTGFGHIDSSASAPSRQPKKVKQKKTSCDFKSMHPLQANS